jgi:hypothetical protein
MLAARDDGHRELATQVVADERALIELSADFYQRRLISRSEFLTSHDELERRFVVPGPSWPSRKARATSPAYRPPLERSARCGMAGTSTSADGSWRWSSTEWSSCLPPTIADSTPTGFRSWVGPTSMPATSTVRCPEPGQAEEAHQGRAADDGLVMRRR